ncbi:hypothetical protein [Macrococcoides caseolyticum]
MGIDADTIIDDAAPYFMIDNFRHAPNLGAVTGKPAHQKQVVYPRQDPDS